MHVIFWLIFALPSVYSDQLDVDTAATSSSEAQSRVCADPSGVLECSPFEGREENARRYHVVAYHEPHSHYNICMFDPKVATILVYRWISVDFDGGLVVDEKERGIYLSSADMKKVNPLLKTCISVTAPSEAWSQVVSNEVKRKAFTRNVADFLAGHRLDCLEINWGVMTNPEDRANLNLLVEDIKEAFAGENLFLMMMVQGKHTEHRHGIFEKWYDVPHLMKFVDYITLDVSLMQEYDVTAGSTPLYSNDDISVEYTVRSWISAGAPAEKLIVAIAASGQSFTLKSASAHDVGAPALGPGAPGPLSKRTGIMSFTETLNFVEDKHWELLASLEGMFPYAYHDDQWISFDSGWSTMIKALFVREQRLGGMGVQILAWDDPLGQYGRPSPLLHITRDILRT